MTRKGHETSVPRDIELVAVKGKKDPEYQILLDCIRRRDKPSDYTNDTHPLRVIGDKYEGMSIVETNAGEALFYTKSGDTTDSDMKLFPPKNSWVYYTQLMEPRRGNMKQPGAFGGGLG